jgi:hypothetical protein
MNMPVVSSVATCGLVPVNMTEAMQLAEMMATAKLVPKDLQKSPADCLMVIQQAIRWQMDPFAVAQECSVIQGKLMHSGKLVAAVINARGNLADRLSFTFNGDNGNRTITVSGRFRGEGNSRTVDVRLQDVRTNNRVWQTQPDQQLMYHGSRVWARRHAPELMLGVYSPEEFDVPDESEARNKSAPTPAKFERKSFAGQKVPERRPDNPNLVIWDDDEEREPTLEEGQEHNEQTIDAHGAGYGDGLIRAVRETAPDHPASPEATQDFDEDGVIIEKTSKEEYIKMCEGCIDNAGNRAEYLLWWNLSTSKKERDDFGFMQEDVDRLKARLNARFPTVVTSPKRAFENNRRT